MCIKDDIITPYCLYITFDITVAMTLAFFIFQVPPRLVDNVAMETVQIEDLTFMMKLTLNSPGMVLPVASSVTFALIFSTLYVKKN